MAVSVEELERFRNDYEGVTGRKVVNGFICPITLVDVPPVELCKGHILNDSLETASGQTVPQWAKVDCHFGKTVEPDFVRFMNLPTKTAAELLEAAKTFKVTLPSGDKVEGFFANNKAQAKFQRVDLLDAEGKPVTSPFFRIPKLEPKIYRGLEVEWMVAFTTSAVLASALKAAYLAMFRLLGYRWVWMSTADKVRRHLLAFYQAGAGKDRSVEYFSEFKGALKVMLNDVPQDHADTLNAGLFWLHFAADPQFPILFAQTCLFKINGKIVTVTLPCTEKDLYYFQAMELYTKLLNDPTIPQSVHPGMLLDGNLHVEKEPLEIRYGAA